MNEFEKWWAGYNDAYDNLVWKRVSHLNVAQAAFRAGAAAGYANGVAVMKERCAEVAEVLAKKWHLHHHDKIAVAIRGMEI